MLGGKDEGGKEDQGLQNDDQPPGCAIEEKAEIGPHKAGDGAYGDAQHQQTRETVGQIVMEIATLGQQGLQINDASVRYDLKSKPGDYSGLHLLSMMHVGIKLFDPNADTESGLDQEYELATAMKK